ncbi:MAG: hypothetical protein K2K34_01390, partial [Oscillospiraceae bacterium]|nr:hypothetical protein [Oscillospiraceae bacterium]
MKNTKKILAGIMALAMTAGLAACGGGNDQGSGDSGNGGGGGGEAENTTTQETITTTAATVAINEEGLKGDEESVLENAMTQLQDVELENKEIKWLAHYD